jgi:hypothetical protein
VKEWIIRHDDSWLFITVYLLLAVVLSVLISLFWLVAVVGVHFAFEWVRQKSITRKTTGVLAKTLWEIKLDIALILAALVVALYADLIVGVAGLGGAARLGARAGAKFAGWQRFFRTILLSIDDAVHLAARTARKISCNRIVEKPVRPADVWTFGDWITVGMLGVCLTLLLGYPLLAGRPYGDALTIISAELHPYPR